MNQLLAIAFGGSVGAVLRFLVSNGVYLWLGRGFPYGTLAVNVIGSLFLGVLVEALTLQRVAIAIEFRPAILVGFFGAFTTFSSFALETVYLLEQGSLAKAALNVLVSVVACLMAVWLGLLIGRTLLLYGGGAGRWLGVVFPYALIIVNMVGAFIIGLITVVLINKVLPSLEHRAALTIILAGLYIILSSLYLILYLIEDGHAFEANLHLMLAVWAANSLICMGSLWLGVLAGEQV
ncbi:MAG: fluoride efflux transporter CrcB [Methylococcaceae bacterium]|nr:fluoride efflux transporter CrcB [Methylococcaceae bacterium]